MELQRSLDRKKGEEGKRKLKTVIITWRKMVKSEVLLKRCKRLFEYDNDRRDFQRP